MMSRAFRRRAGRSAIAAASAAAIVLGARAGGLLQPFELAWYDALVRAGARGGSGAASPITLILAEEEDIARYGWPLPDATLARLLRRLLDSGVAGVAVDLYRDRPAGEGAAELAPLLEGEPRLAWAYRLGEPGRPGVPAPAPVRGTAGAAFADVVVDAGDVVRRALLVATDPADGRVVVSLGTALAVRLTGERLRPAVAEGPDLRFGTGHLRVLEEPHGPYARLDAAGYQILLGFGARFRRLSFAAALEAPLPDLAGAGVILGMESLSVRDSFATPLNTGLSGGTAMPGAMVHAHVAEALLRVARGGGHGAPAPPPRVAEHAGIAAAALLGSAAPLAAATAPLVGGLVALGLAAALGAAALAFGAGLLLPGVPAALALGLGAAFSVLLLWGVGQRQRAALRAAFEHYLDPRVVAALVADDARPRLGGERREVSAMFTDVAGFTALAEALPPPQVAAILNDYFEGLAGSVTGAGGLVVEFAGDGMVALFGAPLDQSDHSARAVAAALAADAFAEGFAARLRGEGVAFGSTRIGVHAGPALVGNLGMRSRMKYGALGDTLNVAARLESLNRLVGTRILVSAAVADRVPGHAFHLLGHVALHGRAMRVTVLSPVARPDGAAALHAQAMEQIRSGDGAQALDLLRQAEALAPDDPLSGFHRRRLEAGLCTLEVEPAGK